MRGRVVAGALLATASVLGVSGASCIGAGDRHPVSVRGEECITCHRDEALLAVDPPHVGRLAEACGDCHGEAAWRPAFAGNHDEFFPLGGRHAPLACATCHTVGFQPGDTPGACIDCHREDFDRSTLPGHDAFPMECGNCHGDAGWTPAAFPDHDRYFPLDGAHALVRCASCHATGFEPGTTPTTCVDCHRDDYDASPYPGHRDFPTTCADCHTTTGWTPATGGTHPEAAFPIADGPHKEIECLDCHDLALGPMGAGNADCVQCHARGEADKDHDEVRDYPSGSAPVNFCLDCHPKGDHD